MPEHITRYNGDQNYCTRCRCSWDRDEAAPPDCIPPLMTQPPKQLKQRRYEPVKKKDLIKPEQWAELRKAIDTGDFSKLL